MSDDISSNDQNATQDERGFRESKAAPVDRVTGGNNTTQEGSREPRDNYSTKRKSMNAMDSGPIDYKHVEKLKSSYCSSGRFRILPRRVTKLSRQKQKEVEKAIKHAKHMALLSYL